MEKGGRSHFSIFSPIVFEQRIQDEAEQMNEIFFVFERSIHEDVFTHIFIILRTLEISGKIACPSSRSTPRFKAYINSR